MNKDEFYNKLNTRFPFKKQDQFELYIEDCEKVLPPKVDYSELYRKINSSWAATTPPTPKFMKSCVGSNVAFTPSVSPSPVGEYIYSVEFFKRGYWYSYSLTREQYLKAERDEAVVMRNVQKWYDKGKETINGCLLTPQQKAENRKDGIFSPCWVCEPVTE